MRGAARAEVASRAGASTEAEVPTSFGPVVLGRMPDSARDGVFGAPAAEPFKAPRHGTVVLVTSVGGAEGSRGAAAALSCAGSGIETAALLVEVGGRIPRPTLIASASAHRLEERLAARLPTLRPAARGEVCHLSVTADGDGLAAAGTAVTVARGGLAVVLVGAGPAAAAARLARGAAARCGAAPRRSRRRSAFGCAGGRRPAGAGLRVAVLKRRLGWVAERRAGFGALGSDSGGLPESLLRRLLDLGTRG